MSIPHGKKKMIFNKGKNVNYEKMHLKIADWNHQQQHIYTLISLKVSMITYTRPGCQRVSYRRVVWIEGADEGKEISGCQCTRQYFYQTADKLFGRLFFICKMNIHTTCDVIGFCVASH